MLPLVKQALLRSLQIFVRWYNVAVLHAGVAELVDAPDSKSGGAKAPCRFEPDLRYHEVPAKRRYFLYHVARLGASPSSLVTALVTTSPIPGRKELNPLSVPLRLAYLANTCA